MSDTGDQCELQTENTVITKDLLQTAIQQREETKRFSVKSFNVTPACEKGSNFASLVLSVKAELQSGEKEVIRNFIVKIPHKEGFMKHWMEERVDFFAKESFAYMYIIPAMVQLQIERGLEPVQPPCPIHYYSKLDGTNGLIILKDLTPEGYVLPDKIKGLDEAHCTLLMKEIATLHALGFGLKNVKLGEKLHYNPALKEGMIVPPPPTVFIQSYNASLMLAKQLCKDQRIIAAIEKMEAMDMFDVMNGIVKPIEPYAVICHGDFWCNNTLFKYDVIGDINVPVEVKLLDLQFIRYALPTTDLAYFFYTSTTRTMRKEKLKMLLTQYHMHFTEDLKRLNIDCPPDFSLERLMDMFKQSALFGIIWSCTMVSAMLSTPDNATDLSESEENIIEHMNQLKEQVLANKEKHHFIQERMIGGIEEAIEMGLI